MSNKRMRALSVIVGFIMSVTILCASVFAFQFEPEWLSAYKWGTSMEPLVSGLELVRLPQSNKMRHYGIDMYAVSRPMPHGAVISYMAIDGKLEAAAMLDIPDENMSHFAAWVIKQLGPPGEMFGKSMTWRSTRSIVMLSWNEHAFLMGSHKGMMFLGKMAIKEGK